MHTSENSIFLIYDGECPMCSSFSKLLKIKEAMGALQLVNAREQHPVLDEIKELKLDVNSGVVVKFNDNFYHGHDALNLLAMLSTDSTMFNRFNAFLFSSKCRARLAYPFLKLIRNNLLKFKNISEIKL